MRKSNPHFLSSFLYRLIALSVILGPFLYTNVLFSSPDKKPFEIPLSFFSPTTHNTSPPPLSPSSDADILESGASESTEASSLIEDLDLKDKKPPSLKEEGYEINFKNVSIISFLHYISEMIGVNFIFDEQDLQFNITIISKEEASRKNLIASLLQILRIHNLSLLEEGPNIIIHKSSTENVSATSHLFLDDSDTVPLNSGLITRVFQLANVLPSQILQILQPLLSPKAITSISDDTKNLIVTDLTTNIDKIEALLVTLDSPDHTIDIGMYYVKFRDISSLVTLASQILAPIAKNAPFNLVPQASTKTIYIISTPYLITKIISVLNSLDIEMSQKDKDLYAIDLPTDHINRMNFRTYQLQYRQGKEIKQSLVKISNSLISTGTANEHILTTISSIQWISSTNSLVFTGTNEAIEKVETLIQSLDIPTKEVFIEMLIIETDIKNALQFGVSLGIKSDKTKSNLIFSRDKKNSTALESGVGTLNALGNPTYPVSSLLNSDAFSLGVMGTAISHGNGLFTSIGALVDALSSDTNYKIVMNQQIVTENNHSAEFFVGTTDRFESTAIQNAQGDFLQTNYEYRKIGSRLRVTPSVANSKMVTLDIYQSINNAVSDDSGGPGPVSHSSLTRTRVHVPDNYFIILSGMITESDRTIKKKLPCLGQIPVVGGAFADNSSKQDRKNLMIFIRPHIISSNEDIIKTTLQQKKRLEESSKSNNLDFEARSLLKFLNLKND